MLPNYLRDLGVPFHIIEQDTYSVVKRVIPEGKTMCGLCSRLRRGALYRFAAENGITKIALGHHRDDIVETLFLNLFFGGRLKAMAPKLKSEDGRHIVIRPLAYVSEAQIERYARARQFPIIPCKLCGSQENAQRRQVKEMLAAWERRVPRKHRVDLLGAAQRGAGAPGGPGPLRLQGPRCRRCGWRVFRSRSLSRTGSSPGDFWPASIPAERRSRNWNAASAHCSTRASMRSST